MPISTGPLALSIEPTTSCNLRCPECPSGLRSFKRPTGMLDVKMFEGLMREIGPRLWYLNVYFQGEPLLHPGFEDIVRAARRHGVYVATSTNAHHITAERAEQLVDCGLNRLVISMDGANQATYEQYRIGGQLERVLEGSRRVMEAVKGAKLSGQRSDLSVVWQFLVTGVNEDQLDEIQAMARKAGVHQLEVKTAQLDAPRDGHPLLTRDPALRRYDRMEDGSWSLRNPMKNECRRMWESAVVTWDGRVVPCCFDKDANHEMGQLKPDGSGFHAIWHNARYTAFRKAIFSDRKSIEMCRNCTEGRQHD
jgi:radical SAM protein with 4Fe4S-binding SPASM domain